MWAGALGLAHIGVLRYFEEHRFPIDDMAGTSMGGLVGGLYSAGMDSRQIIDLVHQIDFEVVPTPLGAAGLILSLGESGKARFRMLIGSF